MKHDQTCLRTHNKIPSERLCLNHIPLLLTQQESNKSLTIKKSLMDSNGCMKLCILLPKTIFKVTNTKSSSSIRAQIKPREYARTFTSMEYSFMFNFFLCMLCKCCLSYIFHMVLLVIYRFSNISHASLGISTSSICTIMESQTMIDN